MRWRPTTSAVVGIVMAAVMPATRADQPVASGKTRLEEVVVSAEEVRRGPFLPDVEGTRITAGKKTSVVELDTLPPIANNN